MEQKELQKILDIILDDSQFVYSKHEPFVKNYKRKIDKKIYNEDLARKGLDHYIPKALETYNSKTNQFITLDKNDKAIFKEIILEKILEDISNLENDF